MKTKIFIINLLISFLLLTGNAFSKALPPGSGIGDVPANVLILLDRSGSMSARMTSGAGVYYPQSSTVDTNGDIYVAQMGTRGIKKFTYDTLLVDVNFGTSGSFRGTTTAGTVCNMRYPVNIAFHGGDLYVTDFYGKALYKYNIANETCDFKKDLNYPGALALNGDILYVSDRNGLYTRNLATDTDLTCSSNVGIIKSAYSMTVDSTGSNLYFYTYRQLNRHQITGDCPSTNMTSRIYWRNLRYVFGMDAHPSDDSILYFSEYFSHKIRKVTMNAARTGYSSTTPTMGKRGLKSSSASQVYMYYPYDLTIDTNNSRIVVSDRIKASIQFFDLNLGFIKELGGSLGTRMSGAHEAIQAIVSDPALKAGVNYGFGWWSSQWRGGSSWFTGWNTKRDQGKPCTKNNCLKVQVNEQGANKTHRVVKSVSPSGGTDAAIWARMAHQYYKSSLSPVDTNSKCQNSYIMVIGDGGWGNHNTALRIVSNLYTKDQIKTFTIAYGGGIGGSGIRNFRAMAVAGGTNDVIIADTTASLKSQLKAAISQIIAAKLSFTAPAISATVEKGGDLYQAQFEYKQNREWTGTLTRTAIDHKGDIIKDATDNWSAREKLPNPNARKIWTVLDTVDYRADYNNFVEGNATEINGMFERLGNEVASYHSKTSTNDPLNTIRCSGSSNPGSADIADGNTDDIKGLINFVRGEDYFDYDSDCDLTEMRTVSMDRTKYEGSQATEETKKAVIKAYLGDIYHSEMVVVGKPSAETAYVGTNQEAYWRALNNYSAWAKNIKRPKVIYVGANDGMLHAFYADGKDGGKEIWGFVPPFIGGILPTAVNANLNRPKTLGMGGSNAIYGVDGSPVVHDMFFKKPGTNGKNWYTILMVPYGRGGAGFSVLDVTHPQSPEHLYSVFNDYILKKVHFVDHEGNFDEWEYLATHYGLASFDESIVAKDNAEDSSTSQTCNSTGTTQCYKGKVWTLPIRDLKRNDIAIQVDQQPYTKFSVSTNTAGLTVITFHDEMTYYGFDIAQTDETKGSSDVSLEILSSSKATGLVNKPEYDYSKLGDTWSAPRIMRLPNMGPNDQNIQDDIYVAVMGGGYAAVTPGIGSNLTIVNLEEKGQVHKVIEIDDIPGNGITNSVPGSPVVITPDTARGINFKGALVYTSDMEGKITKFNLTNMTHEPGGLAKTNKSLLNQNQGGGNQIKLYDNTTLFTAGSNSTNQRYMFHSMDATIGDTTNKLWLYAGTGNYERIANKSTGVENLMLGINDPWYPEYKEINKPTKADDLSECVNTTNNTSGAFSCPNVTRSKGWYIVLDHFKKVTAEPTVSSGLVYFPIYKPTSSVNACSLGDAYICAVDDECGTNLSSRLGQNTKNAQANEKCRYVGEGVLSRIVTFAGKLFANIAGQSTDLDKKDLVQILGSSGEVSTYRNSWRMNY